VDFVSRGVALTYFYVFHIPSGLIQEWYITVHPSSKSVQIYHL